MKKLKRLKQVEVAVDAGLDTNYYVEIEIGLVDLYTKLSEILLFLKNI